MRRSVTLCLGVALLAGVAGCHSCDKVEAELRAREEDVRTLRDDLDRSEFHNQLLSRELQASRGIPLPDGTVPAPTPPYPIRSVRLGRQTGGRPSETCPGDDALQVMLEPLDCDNQALKAPGSLLVEAQEITTEGLKRPLSVWEVPGTELSARWQNGLFTTGYLVTLPWKVWPSTDKLRVIARFRLVDGRVFEADKDVTVRPVPVHKRPPPIVTDVPPITPDLSLTPPVVPPPPVVDPTPVPVLPTPIPPPVTIAPIVPDNAKPAPAPEAPRPAAPPPPADKPRPSATPSKPTWTKPIMPPRKATTPASILPPVPHPEGHEGPTLIRAPEKSTPVLLLRPPPAP